jgi:hypothetical protein
MAELDRQQTRVNASAAEAVVGVEPISFDPTNCSVRKAPRPAFRHSECDDMVLQGFLAPVASCHVERKQLGLRLRARFIAVQMSLAGQGRSTLPQIAQRVGTSTRTLNIQFGVKDALLAFPPPELVPVLFHCWLSAGNADGLKDGLRMAFQELDRNPVARALLLGLGRLHNDQPKLFLTDGYFNAALRSQLAEHPAVPRSCLGWTGYITDALRDTLQEWALSTRDGASLESILPRLMERLKPIAFL